MLYTRLAIAAGAVILAVAAFGSPVGADQPEHLEAFYVYADFTLGGNPASVGAECYQVVPTGTPTEGGQPLGCGAHITIQEGTFLWTGGSASISPSQFTFNNGLNSAHVTATFSGNTCDVSTPVATCTPRTFSIDVTYTATDGPVNYSMGQFKKQEDSSIVDCHVRQENAPHVMTRKVVAEGSVVIDLQQFSVSGTGQFGKVWLPCYQPN